MAWMRIEKWDALDKIAKQTEWAKMSASNRKEITNVINQRKGISPEQAKAEREAKMAQMDTERKAYKSAEISPERRAEIQQSLSKLPGSLGESKLSREEMEDMGMGAWIGGQWVRFNNSK